VTVLVSLLFSTFSSVHDLFHSTAFHVARTVTLFFVVLVWLGLAFWVHRDARRRIDDGLLVATATLLGLVPFLGPLVYLLFRPPETLEDSYARRVEVAALESRLFESTPRCPVCRAEVEKAYLVCPVCTTQLKQPCATCSAPLEPAWQVCPYCTAPVVAAGPPAALDLDEALTAETAGLHDGARRRARSRRSRPPAAP
jgi:double zinc ribbon protein